MKRRVCCLLLGLSILCLPAQEVFAAPLGPAAQAEEQKEEKKPHEKQKEKKKPHEKEKPHEKLLLQEKKGPGLLKEKPVPPAAGEKLVHPVAGEKPVPPHEKKKTELEAPMVTPPEATPNVEEPVEETVEDTLEENQQNNSVDEEQKKEETEEVEVVVEKEVRSLQQQVVDYALQFVGNPYKWGGTSLTNGADCSGFVQAVYGHFDYSLARTSREQAKSAGYRNVEIKESELMPGDLIFYANSSGVVYHVALYIGDGKIIHAANAKKGIIVSEYAYMKPYKARRVIE